MTVYKVNYQYASPTGDLRTGSRLCVAELGTEALDIVRKDLVGRLRHFKAISAVEYVPDQLDLLEPKPSASPGTPKVTK